MGPFLLVGPWGVTASGLFLPAPSFVVLGIKQGFVQAKQALYPGWPGVCSPGQTDIEFAVFLPQDLEEI